MAVEPTDDELLARYERMNAWMRINNQTRSLPVVDWGVVQSRHAVVVGVRERNAEMERRMRSEVGEPLVFEVTRGSYRPA